MSNKTTEERKIQCINLPDGSVVISGDDFDRMTRDISWMSAEIRSLRADLAIQVVNAKTVTDLQEEIARLNAVSRLRFSDDASAESK